jgi:hypothetical protein
LIIWHIEINGLFYFNVLFMLSTRGALSYYLFYRAALDKKKVEEKKTYQAIDYDAPIESDKSTIGFGTRVGISIHRYRVLTIW